MARPVHQVSAGDLWCAATHIDAAASVAPARPADRAPALALVIVTDPVGAERLVVADPVLPVRYALPVAALRAVRSAALTLAVARLLMAPGVVTAAVLDTTDTAGPRALLVAHQLPGVDHVVVHGSITAPPPGGSVARHPTLGSAASIDEAVFGASLVVVAGCPRRSARPAQLARGALVVNATGRPLPVGLLSRVDVRFVDDCTLHGPAWDEQPGSLPVRADLRELRGPSASSCTGPMLPHDVALVDLLGTNALDPQLAFVLCRALALQAGTASSRF